MAQMTAGMTFVYGLTPEIARTLLAACDRLGIDQMHVRTVPDGFEVPDAVADEAADDLEALAGGADPAPDDPDKAF